MPKIQKKETLTVQELNKPITRKVTPKKTSTNYLAVLSLIINIITAVSVTYIAYSVYAIQTNTRVEQVQS